jgi:hypothetical protein
MGIRLRAAIVLAALCLAAPEARAQSVQIAPFAGYQFGGSFHSPVLLRDFDLESGLSYGGTLDIGISEHFRVEMLYSRQETKLEGNLDGGIRPDVNVERYMGGIQEEKGEGPSKFFGTFLLGVTRFVPGLPGFDSKSRFALGVGLGGKRFLGDHFGLRIEARGFYTFTETDGGVYCNGAGTCLFVFSGQGLWQGEISGGLILRF